MSEAICKGCGKPVLAGEARFALFENADPPEFWHWSCREQHNPLSQLREAVGKVINTAESLRRRLRNVE